jgi:hypothetical protein
MIPMEDIPSVRDSVSRIVDGILTTAAPQGTIDAVNELGRAVPYQICGEYFGFPDPDRISMYSWSKATQTDYFKNVSNNPQIHQTAIDASAQMKGYLTGLIQSRRAELAADTGADRKDVLTRLLQTKFAPGLGFSEDELVTNMCAILVGAIETTSQAIVQALEQRLLRPPVVAAALTAAKAGDNAAFDAFVWEALRFNPINPLLFRVRGSSHIQPKTSVNDARLSLPTPERIASLLVYHALCLFWDGPSRYKSLRRIGKVRSNPILRSFDSMPTWFLRVVRRIGKHNRRRGLPLRILGRCRTGDYFRRVSRKALISRSTSASFERNTK